ncbi:UTP--glucose-1-phosphate uridylyltransferase GalU [Thioalkalivibrio sp. XN279]|uniref:UTP--glucose-1-phosphate uridylyltransferase GalU n=1 Tax=Thioalkalivibrio sp. XN279 TaxID=2714953 RepID=UPI00140B8709|nr:UTP--glucose-1-phosphate uridylyltransferase GalU [Thioalkalivibrio sp. XN279]NHA14510.1 UTP--glucose-1-phosphate uridylyltransferase GalU [Thioalkalivibrio sp. XN279]
MSTQIRYAVFPVAGKGTRFLPATKASPKEMLPVVDKPLIQYAVEEAIEAGAKNLVFITGRHKRAIEDHFDVEPELERLLASKDKEALLEMVRNTVPPDVNCIYVRQGEPLGLGHAVLCARPVVGNQPFFVHLADDLIDAEEACLAQMARVFAAHGGSVLGVEEVPHAQTRQYGIIDGEPAGAGLRRLRGIVEKPDPADAPSNLAVVGRYILTPRIFDLLADTGAGAGGEIQLTDAIARLLREEPVFGHEFKGLRFDCGSKLGYLEATVHYALKHPELGTEFRRHLASLDV